MEIVLRRMQKINDEFCIAINFSIFYGDDKGREYRIHVDGQPMILFINVGDLILYLDKLYEDIKSKNSTNN